jgi:hypothetical protein
MCLTTPFTVRRVPLSHTHWSSNEVFSFSFFSLSSALKIVLPFAKNKRVCYLLSLSYLVLLLLIVPNYIFYFKASFGIWFLYIFALLFYDVSSLTLNVLIFNLDSCLFYEILISFQFCPCIYDLISKFFHTWSSFSLFYFFFGFFCEFEFSFQFNPSIQFFMVFVAPDIVATFKSFKEKEQISDILFLEGKGLV